MAYSNILEQPLKIYRNYPSIFGTSVNYVDASPQQKYDDGWRDYVRPTIDSSTQKSGQLIFDVQADVVTNEVIQLTQEEIQSQITAQAKIDQGIKAQQILEAEAVANAQTLPDDDALENIEIYPLWSEFEEEYLFEPPMKVQDFNNENELKLFRAIQPNNKRSNTKPILFPAGWTLIEFSGGIEVWSQPTGGDGKYPYIDPLTGVQYLVEHNGQIWQNTYEAGLNVWEPGVFGWTIYTP